MKPAVIAAPAKLNLALHITGKRMDGYHTLQSLVAFTEFSDTLEILPADTLTLTVTGPFADDIHVTQEHNLVIQAAGMLRLRGGCASGARMALNKQIPVEAGLGGGSSDAAAALRGLSRFWRLYEDDDMLHKVAVKLGSDVPVCLAQRASWMTGIGEQVKPLAAFPDVAAVLVNPKEPLATADVYRRFTGPFSNPAPMLHSFASLDELIRTMQQWRNDLQAPAIALMPGINDLLNGIAHTRGCLLARMSGSGPTCFGLYATHQEAEQAAHDIQRIYPSWWSVPTRLQQGQIKA